MKRCLPILLIPFVLSCISRKALPSELVLFPKTNENKLWLINTISENAHFCSLITIETIEGKEYVNCFSSLWSKKNSSFNYGIRITDKANTDYRTEFPVVFNLLKSDSVATDWNWMIDRKKMGWNGEFSGEPSSVKVKYKTQLPFRVSQIIGEPEVWMMVPVKSKIKIKGKQKAKDNNTFCMNVFKNTTNLSKLSFNGSLIWMDLLLDDKCLFSGLFRVNDDNTVILSYNLRDSSGHYFSTGKLTVEAKTYWKSVVSGKSYPLNLSLQLPGYPNTILIRPLIENQEINAKKSSFWMGAVEAVSPDKKTRQGRGNMYIFNNKIN